MSKLHKKIDKALPKEARTPIDKEISEENIRAHESLNKRVNPKMPTSTEEDEKAIPLPDEEELARIRRRKGRGGGRASTVLTDDEKLGG